MPTSEGLVDAGLVESQVETIRSERIARASRRAAEAHRRYRFVGTGRKPYPAGEGRHQEHSGLVKEREPGDSPANRFPRAIPSLQPEGAPCWREFRGKRGVHVRKPRKAAEIANAIAAAYIEDKLTFRADTMRKASVWLEDRIKELPGPIRRRRSGRRIVQEDERHRRRRRKGAGGPADRGSQLPARDRQVRCAAARAEASTGSRS